MTEHADRLGRCEEPLAAQGGDDAWFIPACRGRPPAQPQAAETGCVRSGYEPLTTGAPRPVSRTALHESADERALRRELQREAARGGPRRESGLLHIGQQTRARAGGAWAMRSALAPQQSLDRPPVRGVPGEAHPPPCRRPRRRGEGAAVLLFGWRAPSRNLGTAARCAEEAPTQVARPTSSTRRLMAASQRPAEMRAQGAVPRPGRRRAMPGGIRPPIVPPGQRRARRGGRRLAAEHRVGGASQHLQIARRAACRAGSPRSG